MDTTESIVRYYVSDPQRLGDLLMAGAVRLAAAIVVLVIGMIAIRLITAGIRRVLTRAIEDPTVRSYTLSIAKIFLWVILAVTLLSVFGIETTSVVAIVGAAGLAIGLALQGSLSNFAAGFMLMIFRPFRAGDEVEFAGVAGTVIEIGIFSTTVDLPEHVRAFVPNSMIFSGVIKNKSIKEYMRVDMKVTLADDTDVERAIAVVRAALRKNEHVIDIPRPEVKLIEDEASGITIGVQPYALPTSEIEVRDSVPMQVRSALQSAGIEVLKQ